MLPATIWHSGGVGAGKTRTERCTECSTELKGFSLSSHLLCHPPGGWVGGKRRKSGGRRARVTAAEALPAFQRWEDSEAAGPLTPDYKRKVRKGTPPPAGRLCVLAAPVQVTHPVMDVSTSCISGTTSTRLLSCRDSERSTLPLCGREHWSARVWAAASQAPYYSSTNTPQRLARHLIYPLFCSAFGPWAESQWALNCVSRVPLTKT